jgi:DNA-3-methyladenine glycosylase
MIGDSMRAVYPMLRVPARGFIMVYMRALPDSFFHGSAVIVARELIGKTLVRKRGSTIERFTIVETEAYEGPHDLASHASRGRTPRTAVMFGPPGRLYIYFIYGMYHMLNIVTGPDGHPGAVLIRGVKGISGPGRLTRALAIGKDMNTKKLGRAAGLWIEEGETVPPRKILRTPRIGVNYAGPVWSQKRYRFVVGVRNSVSHM